MGCHCICAIHRHFRTVQCRGQEETTARVLGAERPRNISMCKNCAMWWEESQQYDTRWLGIYAGG